MHVYGSILVFKYDFKLLESLKCWPSKPKISDAYLLCLPILKNLSIPIVLAYLPISEWYFSVSFPNSTISPIKTNFLRLILDKKDIAALNELGFAL